MSGHGCNFTSRLSSGAVAGQLGRAVRFLALLIALTVAGCTAGPQSSEDASPATAVGTTSYTPSYVDVRYRDDPVDIANPALEHLDTARSSFIRGAWYDASNQYMIINLRGIYYHYCEMPEDAWLRFTAAASFGRHYSQQIQGRYDCRIGRVPEY